MITSATLFLLLAAGPSPQNHWPQFRGADGTATASLKRPVEEVVKHVAWRVELDGTGHSSPVVHGDTVYVTSSNGGERTVQALSLMDGSIRWAHGEPLSKYRSHELNDAASATPVVDGERVYLSWVDGDRKVALALDVEGEVLWRRQLGPYAARHGGGASPVLVDGVLVVANDNESDSSALFGLDPATGEVRWKRDRQSSRASFATPAIQRLADGKGRILFASTSHGITCLEPSDGSVLWEQDDLFEQRCVATPVVAAGLIFTSAGRGGGGEESAVLSLVPDEGGSRRQFQIRRALPYVPSGVATDEFLFLVSDGGIASCTDLAGGEEVWRERLGGEYFGSPVLVDDRLVIASKAGELVIFAASFEFEVIARVDLDERCFSTPAVAGGKLLIRTETELIAFGS